MKSFTIKEIKQVLAEPDEVADYPNGNVFTTMITLAGLEGFDRAENYLIRKIEESK